MNNRLLAWEVSGFFFIGLVGAGLHYTFELSGFSRPMALISSVNESTWEHLKMVFWPGLIFALVEFTYVRDLVKNYWFGKAASLIAMPAVITVGWYAYTPFTGTSVFPLDLALFYLAVFTGQFLSYKILTARPFGDRTKRFALVSIVLMLAAFSLFTYFPPQIFLFEHLDLLDTGQYGILESYEGLRVFTEPSPAGDG